MSRTITDQVGVARYPSPRIWKDCRNGLLNDLGLGFFQHSEFNGGFQNVTLSIGSAPVLPDPADTPANVDAFRDDLTAVWEIAVEQAFVNYGGAIALTVLGNGRADTAAGLALLMADIEVQMREIEAAFLVQGVTMTISRFDDPQASDDAAREVFVATVNPEIEAAFALVSVNDEIHMDGFSMDMDTDAKLTALTGKLGGFMDMETDDDDNDAFAIFIRPFGEIERNSGKKMWFEVAMQPGAVADQGIFIGFAEEAALNRDVIADDVAATIGESYVGFRQVTDEDGEVDAVYKLNAGTEVEVGDDVTNSAALPSAQRADIIADTVRKYGFRFDGRTTIEFFVDGVKVASTAIADATFPTNVNLGFVFAIKTGSAARVSAALDWVRVAYEEVH